MLHTRSLFFYRPRFYSSVRALPISNILETKNIGGTVKIQGWVKSLRKMKESIFFDVTDGSCEKCLQIVVHKQKPKGLSTGASVGATGILNITPKGQLELTAEDINVYGQCGTKDGYPFASKQKFNAEYLRQHLHLRPRISEFGSLLRVRDCATREVHNYLHELGYTHIHTPILTSNDCEGAGETFYIIPDNKQTLTKMAKPGVLPEDTYFNSKVFLTVSGQLQLEAAAHSLSKVYTFGPTFRAENSKSRLHLSEFYMLETECAFIETIENLTESIESLMKNVAQRVLDKCGDDINLCREDQGNYNWLNSKFITLQFDEAVLIITKHFGNINASHGLTKEQELFLVKHCDGIPVFVVNWPKELKPFYMKNCTEDSTKVAALDLLVPNVGELVGGSLREDNYEKLKEKLPAGKASLDWYLDIRKYGGVPTGGFGLGFERYLQFLLGISNIKDTIPFPRWPHNCSM